MKAHLARVAFYSSLGLGYALGQRLLDHLIDWAIAGHPWLAWLQ